MIRTMLVMAVLILIAGLSFYHRSSAGFAFGVLFCLFAFVAWLARPGRKNEL